LQNQVVENLMTIAFLTGLFLSGFHVLANIPRNPDAT